MDTAVARGKKILVVDDANVFLSLATKMLQRTGAVILSARNGVEAMKLIHSESPDVVILDLLMPEMTGDKVCSMIKGDPATAGIPVIIVTSRGMPEELERCRRAGCDDFLTKPVKEGLLVSKLGELLKVAQRHTIRVLVRMEEAESKEVFFGISLDVSKTGMQLETGKKLELDEQITLHFFLKSDQEELTASGKVIRKEKSKGGFLYGIQFASLSLPRRRALNQFLDARAARK